CGQRLEVQCFSCLLRPVGEFRELTWVVSVGHDSSIKQWHRLYRCHNCTTGGLAEPDLNLTFGRQSGIGSVNEVLLYSAAPVTAKISTNRARLCQRRVGDAGQSTDPLDDTFSFNNRSNDWSGSHEVHKRFKEAFSFVFFIM